VATAFGEWMAYYRRERIEAVGFGLITLRGSARLTHWFRCDGFSELSRPSGQVIEQGFARYDFLEAHRDDEALLRACLRPVGGLRWELEREVSDGGLTDVASRLRSGNGLSPVGEADANVVAFVARCSGDRPLGDHVAELAASTGQDVRRVTPSVLTVVRHLLELGVLVPA